MSEPRLCCNCLHCARWKKKDGIECHCDLDDRYLGYLTVMDEENDCKHWEKETKWDLEREHDKQIRAEVLKEVEDTMYHEAFKVSHEEDGLQKWDGGNWIRYKLFEKVMGKLRQTNGSSIEEENR